MMKSTEDIYEQKTDYKEIFLNFFRYKYLFLLSLVFFLLAAHFYNENKSPTWENNTSVLVNRKNIYAFLKTEDLMESFGQFQRNDRREDELDILQSFTLVNDAISKMNAAISYYGERGMISGREQKGSLISDPNELYEKAPFMVKIDPYHLQPVDMAFQIRILSGDSFLIIGEQKNVWLYDYKENKSVTYAPLFRINRKYRFNDIIDNDYMRVKIILNDSFNETHLNKDFYFTFNNLNYLTIKYKSALSIQAAEENSSVFFISMRGDNPERITDFLNILTSVYLDKNLLKKNRIIENTIDFIDRQIADISDDLISTENKLQSFRSEYHVMDLSFQGERIYEKLNELEEERAKLIVQKQYYDYVKNYFKRNEDVSDLVAPSTLNVEDPLLNKLIEELVSLSSTRSNYLSGDSPKNIFLKEIEIRINNLKETILENINNNFNKLNIQLKDLNRRLNNLSAEIAQLPKTERELFGIQRTFKLNDAIYTFLLQKRAEAQIAKASNSSDYEIIDPARVVTAYIISPKKRLNLLIALVLGLFLPLIYIVLKDFFISTLQEEKDIKAVHSFPFLSSIGHNSKRTENLIKDHPEHVIANQFRDIFSSLLLNNEDNKLILLSSAEKGSGKTFCSLNLASVAKEIGKRTLIIDFDHKKATISRILRKKTYPDPEKTMYKGLQKQIQHLEDSPDLLSMRTISEHPFNLSTSEEFVYDLRSLRDKYNFIILDCPNYKDNPHVKLLAYHADVLIFVLRQGKTKKNVLLEIKEEFQFNTNTSRFVLFNDFRSKKNLLF
jgi:tyrosine-protein kinase Etk/Wzc